jgi:hypothetical protein
MHNENLCLYHIYLHLSSYSWKFHQNLELFDLKNSQIWSLLKLLFLGANAIRKSISSRDSRPDPFIRTLDSGDVIRSMSESAFSIVGLRPNT